jgi:excisionase family DNA binding protein
MTDDDIAAFTIAEYCRRYRICRETAYREIRAGRLPARKLGRKTLILRADAETWAAGLPELRQRKAADAVTRGAS